MNEMDDVLLFEEFFSKFYLSEITDNYFNKCRKYIVVDFTDLIKFSPNLGEQLLDSPEEVLKCANLAVNRSDVLNDFEQEFTVRFKNLPPSCTIPINGLRAKHLGKLLYVKGMIKQKSSIRPHITSVRFECPSCGNILSVLQTDDRRYKEPTTCGCGRKGKFCEVSKETIDAFSMVVEELVESVDGSKLEQLHILCKSVLSDPEIERALRQGSNVEIVGQLVELPVYIDRRKTSKLDWYLDANYIKICEETYLNLTYTPEDVVNFKLLATQQDRLQLLRDSMFYDVYGYEEECESIILQMFGGVGKIREGLNMRGDIHILLVGDPGIAKSSVLKITQAHHPKARYVAGKGVSGTGVTAAVVKDELLGGFTVEAGTLVLCNEGLCAIDELDKIPEEHRDALHEPLEQQTVSIAKGNVQATMPARTSILASANPKHGSFSTYDSVYSQIDLVPTLINRFDLVFPLKDSKLSKKDNYEIAMNILSRGFEEKETTQRYSKQFIRKYISYAKQIIPKFSLPVAKYLANIYKDIKERRRSASSDDEVAVIPFTARNVDGARRISEAVARSRLSSRVTKNDVDIALKKITYSIEQIGIDQVSGEVLDVYVSGVHTTNKDILVKITSYIRSNSTKGRLVHGQDIYDNLMASGEEEEKIKECLFKLKKQGDVMEIRPDAYRLV